MTTNLNKWGISGLFEKDEKGNYTNDSLLCQDILNYHSAINKTVQENNSFYLRDLQKWVVQNNLEIRQYYTGSKAHTSLANRVRGQETRINNKFQCIMELQLIKRSLCEKLPSNTSLYTDKVSYEFTKGGVFLAVVIRSMYISNEINITKNQEIIVRLKKGLDKVHQDAYDIIELTFKIEENSPASNIFYSIFFQKCKDKGLLGNLVNRIRFILNWDYNIKSIPDLLERATHDPFLSEELQVRYTDLSLEVIQELDQETRKLILYYWKIDMENRFKRKLEQLTIQTRGYEEFRFNLKSDYEKIALKGFCENCKNKQDISLHYSELGKLYNIDDSNIRLDCSICKTSNSLLVPRF